jgi:ABC-type cobalt transport system permease component
VGAHMVFASTIRLSPGTNLFFYVLIWIICAAGIGVVAWAALRSKRWPRWTTQDILIVAALGVLLEVYDNIIGDQFITPLLGGGNSILHFLQIHDLPYMFLLMVGVALVRKPGCVTAMIFINFLLAALLFGSGHGVLDWTDGLTQGLFCDLYIVARRGRVYGTSATKLSMVLDGLMIGILRGSPNALLTDWNFDPYLNAQFYTWLQMWNDTWSNGLFNGIEAAASAVLAQRVAVAVVPSLGIGKAKAGVAATDPFAEPDQQPVSVSGQPTTDSAAADDRSADGSLE